MQKSRQRCTVTRSVLRHKWPKSSPGPGYESLDVVFVPQPDDADSQDVEDEVGERRTLPRDIDGEHYHGDNRSRERGERHDAAQLQHREGTETSTARRKFLRTFSVVLGACVTPALSAECFPANGTSDKDRRPADDEQGRIEYGHALTTLEADIDRPVVADHSGEAGEGLGAGLG